MLTYDASQFSANPSGTVHPAVAVPATYQSGAPLMVYDLQGEGAVSSLQVRWLGHLQPTHLCDPGRRRLWESTQAVPAWCSQVISALQASYQGCLSSSGEHAPIQVDLARRQLETVVELSQRVLPVQRCSVLAAAGGV